MPAAADPVLRKDGRAPDELREWSFERNYTVFAAGSVLVSMGRTKVLCTASIEDDIPRWLRGSGKGWVTAEYSMLPGSTPERASREAARGKQSGRTQEIQRLIGRSLRAVTDLAALAEFQVTVDCDVIQADGGTRTASICGGYVALHDAFTRMLDAGRISHHPIIDQVAAISVGIVDAVAMLDLPYEEDSRADVDMNVVMTGAGRFVEVQGTAEKLAFSRGELDQLLALATTGIDELLAAQRAALAEPPGPLSALMRLVLATANPDKAREIAAILAPVASLELVGRPSDVGEVDETGDTLVENATIKATAISEATGLAAIADDTGLFVDALDGAPGVYAARYAGPDATYADNVDKLLRALEATTGPRTARFETAVVVAAPGREPVVAVGTLYGEISRTARGTSGFGYDPVFVPDGLDGRTLAELSADEKHATSHRGRALRAMAERLTAG